jgi:conjugative relaxase-like TrwC/TraI family protein
LAWCFRSGRSRFGQHRYYEQQVAQGQDDYYTGRGEAPGEWVGAGAQALGLQGRVGKGQFGALIAGHDPRDPGARLRSGAHDPKVAAYDLTFSAPKTLSILFAVAPESVSGELVGCHEEAVRAVLRYLEDAAVAVRRGHAGEHVQFGEGLIAAAYRHRMSRALDPQLHTHVVAANLARGPDGRFTALHGAELYRAAKTAGYLYQAHLRALVTERLGLEWGRSAMVLQSSRTSSVRSWSTSHSAVTICAARRSGAGLAWDPRARPSTRRSLRGSASSTGCRRIHGGRRSGPAPVSRASTPPESWTCCARARSGWRAASSIVAV